MKNIFALFMIFMGMLDVAPVFAATIWGGGDTTPDIGGETETNVCEGSCDLNKKPCKNYNDSFNGTKCYDDTTYSNAYVANGIAKCSGTIDGCKWTFKTNVDIPVSDMYKCKENYYLDNKILCLSENIFGTLFLSCCAPCPYPDFSETPLLPKVGATSPAECYVPGPITTESENDAVWFMDKYHKKLTDKNGNTFILIDDCHHNDYVAPATPASDE